MKVLVDTNICIDHLRGFYPATEYLLKLNNMERWISVITVMELFAAPNITAEQKNKITALINGFNGIIDINKDIAEGAGSLIGEYRKSHTINPIDALIAESAIFMDAVLATQSKKHFDFIKGIIVDCPY